jgi:hypothetical protein
MPSLTLPLSSALGVKDLFVVLRCVPKGVSVVFSPHMFCEVAAVEVLSKMQP